MQRERLAALGFELLTLRERAPATGAARVDSGATAGLDASPAPRLVVAGLETGALEGGEGAALFGALLATLGLSRAQVTVELRPGLPLLAFGDGGGADAIRIAPLAHLRQPHEKRAAWPALRALRARLRGAAEPT